MIKQGRDAKLVHSPRARARSTAAARRGGRPVLIVKVDVAGVDPEGAQRACDVRLVRTTREQVVDQRRDSGADGEVTAVVILRDATPSHVASCVRAATGGGPISSEALRQIRLLEGEETAQATATKLSEREYEVLRMLADGESTRGIAERLSYSERTVKNIVHDLLAKLNCKTRAHAVALAARQGVI